MRIATSVFCVLLISLGFTLSNASAQDEVVAEIQRTAVPPVIDGLPNDGVWMNATSHGTDEFFTAANEPPDDDEDLSVTWKGLWDDTNLYVLIQVTDDVIVNDDSCNWEDDSAEIYLDSQNLDVEDYRPPSGIPAYQLTAIAGDSVDSFCNDIADEAHLIEDGSTSVFRWGINSYDGFDEDTQYPEGADTSASVIVDDNHWNFEVAFPWEAIENTPENILAAGEFGFGIAVNDDDDGGGRDTQLMWATMAGDLWMRSDTFPSVALSTEVVEGGGEVKPHLQPGDANQDLKFDQLDLVQVQVAAKYLTGHPATWGEGDWNGAPGGEQGNPPQGNGLFDQIDIIAALGANVYLTGPYAAIAPGGKPDDEQTSIVYDPATGELAVNAPASTQLTSINIDSAASIFTGEAALNLGGSFDNDADNNIFKATFGSSFGSLSFGNVAQPGLSEDFVLNDLTVIGSLAGGGDLGAVDLIYVPEPSAAVLLIVGLVGVVTWQRRRIR